ncbi:hypothetical protein vcoNHCC006C_001138B, partial [Vibrio cholerae O1 str. NHCC-006C]
ISRQFCSTEYNF